MKKRLNTEAISNELHGASLFFPASAKQDFRTGEASPAPAIAPAPSDAQASGHLDVQTPRRPDVAAPRHLDTRLDLNQRADSRQTLRLTEGEFRRLGMLQAELSDQLGVTRVEKNDILRAGLHRTLEEFAEQGSESDLTKRLRKKYR